MKDVLIFIVLMCLIVWIASFHCDSKPDDWDDELDGLYEDFCSDQVQEEFGNEGCYAGDDGPVCTNPYGTPREFHLPPGCYYVASITGGELVCGLLRDPAAPAETDFNATEFLKSLNASDWSSLPVFTGQLEPMKLADHSMQPEVMELPDPTMQLDDMELPTHAETAKAAADVSLYDKWQEVDLGKTFPSFAPYLHATGEYHEDRLRVMLECALNKAAFKDDPSYQHTCHEFLTRAGCPRGKDWYLHYYTENIFRLANKPGDVLMRLRTDAAVLKFVNDLEAMEQGAS